jgi:hypothetical protein
MESAAPRSFCALLNAQFTRGKKMKRIAICGLISALGATGCASTGVETQSAERGWSGIAWHGDPAIQVGEARVIDTSVKPRTILSASSDGAKPARVVLHGGRFVLVWKRGSIESGYRALAQEFAMNGSPLGGPVVLSPRDIDVMGWPQAVAIDGQHVVATFAGASKDSVKLISVAIEPQGLGLVASDKRAAPN